MWLNHGTMGTTHGWFPQHGQNHRSYPVFFIIKRVWFLKGSVARAFCILLKFVPKFFLLYVNETVMNKILFSDCLFKWLDSIPARLQAVVNSVWEFVLLLSFVYMYKR